MEPLVVMSSRGKALFVSLVGLIAASAAAWYFLSTSPQLVGVILVGLWFCAAGFTVIVGLSTLLRPKQLLYVDETQIIIRQSALDWQDVSTLRLLSRGRRRSLIPRFPSYLQIVGRPRRGLEGQERVYQVPQSLLGISLENLVKAIRRYHDVPIENPKAFGS